MCFLIIFMSCYISAAAPGRERQWVTALPHLLCSLFPILRSLSLIFHLFLIWLSLCFQSPFQSSFVMSDLSHLCCIATLIQTRPVNASDNETSAAWRTTPKNQAKYFCPNTLHLAHNLTRLFPRHGARVFSFLMCWSLSPRNCIITLITVGFGTTAFPTVNGIKGIPG